MVPGQLPLGQFALGTISDRKLPPGQLPLRQSQPNDSQLGQLPLGQFPRTIPTFPELNLNPLHVGIVRESCLRGNSLGWEFS